MKLVQKRSALNSWVYNLTECTTGSNTLRVCYPNWGCKRTKV
jgi:hypothetical protein